MAKLGDLVVRIGADTRNLNKSLGKVQRNMRSMTSNFTALGNQMTKAITLPILGIGAMAIKSAADLETMEVSFISLTGGVKQAADMMKQLNDFTANTPFQIDAVATAARQLIASGTKISEVNEQLQFLGDIAATSGSSIDEIAAIFSKVNAKGKVELESLNQLAERGIPIFKALSDATGLPAEKLGAGAVSVQQFNEVLKSFAKQGGFAEGAMERLSQTTSGKFSTAMDNLKLAGASLVESIMPLLKQLIDKVTVFAKAFTRLDPKIKTIILMVGGLAAVIGPLLIVLPSLGVALSGAFAIATGPIGLVVAGITAMTLAFFHFFDKIERPLTNHINSIIRLYNEFDLVRIAIGGVMGVFKTLGIIIETQITTIINALSAGLGTWVILFSEGPRAAAKHFKKAANKLFTEMAEGAKAIYDGVKQEVEEHIARDPIELLEFGDLGKKKDEVLALLDFSTWFKESGTATEEHVSSLLNRLSEFGKSFVSDVEEIGSDVVLTTGYVTQAFNNLGQSISNAFVDAIFEAQNFGDAMIAIGKQIVKALLSEAIANAISNASSAKNLANQASGGLTIPAFITAAVGSVKAAFSNIPALAEGGLAYGRSLVEVGEYSGAGGNPEVIAPLNKLKDMIGGGSSNLYGRISGDDIVISNSRAARDRNRYV